MSNSCKDVGSYRNPRDEDFLSRIAGLDATWIRTLRCPNVVYRRSGGPDHPAHCPLCSGRLYVEYEREETSLLVSNLGAEDVFLEGGTYLQGMINVILPPDYIPAFYDRIRFPDQRLIYSENLERQSSERYDFLPRFFPHAIEMAASSMSTDVWGRVYDTVPPDPNAEVQLVRHNPDNFAIDSDGNLLWAGSDPYTKSVSFRYTFIPEYVVVEIPKPLRLGTDALNNKRAKVIAQLDGLALERVERTERSKPREGDTLYRYQEG